MLEQWDTSRYLLKHPYIESFHIEDVRKRMRHNKRRPLKDYFSEKATIPINVAPELLHSVPAKRYERLSRRLRKNIGFSVAHFPYEDPATGKDKLTPVHLFTTFNHNGFSVAGPWFPSLGHPVMTAQGIPYEIKKAFVQESVFHMQEFFDLVVIGIPSRKEGSGTDEIFTDSFLGGIALSTFACKDITFYLFQGTSNKNLNVVLDQEFFDTINGIELCRRKNFEEYKRKSARKSKPSGYALDVNTYLKHIFRKVLPSNQAN